MVIDSNSTLRSKDGRGGNNTKKNPAMSKGKPTLVSASSSLRRSTRGITSREQVKSTSLATETVPEEKSVPSNTRKSERIEKKCTTPPVKRKSEILERDTSSSTLRRSDRGKKLKSIALSDSNNNGKVNDSPNVNKKKLRTEKSVKQLTVEAIETNKEAKQAKASNGRTKKKMNSNGRTKKKMNAHAYKNLFLQQRRKQILPALAEDLETPEKLFQGDITSLVDNVSNHVEDEANGAVDCTQKTEEKRVESDCGGNEQSMLKEDNDNTPANHGVLESSCLNLCSSREALGEPSQENGVNVFGENMTIEKSIDDSERLQVDNALVVELQTPVEERLPDNNVVEAPVLVPLPSSECEMDKSVGTCASCCKRGRLNDNSPMPKLCSCSLAAANDLLKTSPTEDRVELAQCDDSLNDALNDGNLSTCAICKLDENLLCCDGKGCRQAYHLSCLDIPLDDGLPGVWHCFSCVKKKIEFGAQSASSGIEAGIENRICMPDSSRFLEYWVPVSASNVQLEQYCATLLSNSMTLRSFSIKNITEALHDILISTKKCCDHPYLVDSGLQGFLNKDLPPLDYLDMGIKASGKLQLLETILSEIKIRGKRVLILYQSIPLADILDDFLRQRFGVDSYERVEGGTLLSKKQAVKIFNDKGSGRFVLLLEKRACSSAIKLTSVDAVVIFDSDWNIMNDSRALHKLSIDSYPEPIKIFRLFTSGTLEEKVLDLATNNLTSDSSLHKLNRTTSHMLLMWGASYLFSKLDEFHGLYESNSGASLCSDKSMLENVAEELLDILTQKAENLCKDSVIIKVRQTGVTYSKNVPLFGQLKGLSTDGKEPCLFWKELLECKNPRWRLLPVHSQRNRKRVHYFSEPDDVTKRQKKTINSSADALSPKTRQEEGEPGVIFPKSTDSIPFSSNDVSPASEVPMADSVEEKNLGVLQKNLHGLLMPTISELGEVLQISEDMKTMGEIFLDYIVNNHQINSESESILQALQISLIWIAASLLKHKLDKKQTFDVAKRQLGFGCTEEEVNGVYLRLRRPKKNFKKTSEKCRELLSKKDVCEDRLQNFQNKHEKKKKKLQQEHEEEIQEFNSIWDGKRAQIDKDHRAKSAVIRKVYFSASTVRLDKLKEVDDELAKKLDEHKREKDLRLQELKGKQLDKRTKEDQKAGSWLKSYQENVVSVSGEQMRLNRTETTEVASSTDTLVIPTIPLHSLCETGKIENQLGKVCCSNDAFGSSTVGDNLPRITEQIPDSATSGAQETDVNEFAGGVESSDISKPSGESNEDNDQRNEIDIVDSELMRNCSDAAGGSRNVGICTEPPLVTSHLVQILDAPAQDVASLTNLAGQDESSRASTSAEILVGDSPGCENTNLLEQTDIGHPTSAEFIAHNNNTQVCENSNILEQPLVHPLHPTRADVSLLGSCAGPSILHHGDSGANENHNVTNPELTGPLPNVEEPSSRNGEKCNVQNDEFLNNDDTQMGTTSPAGAPVVGLVTHHPSLRAQHMNLSAQLQNLQPDPLQIELERLLKETEEASKLHEDAKLQVKSEYEKELAELRRKYEAKLEGVEAVYLMKMKERDANHRKVFMNKLLAETLRNDCRRPSESSGTHQVPATNYQQQLCLLSSQSRRTSAAPCFPNIVPPAPNQQNTVPPVRAPPRSSPIMQTRQTCTRFIGNVPPPPPAAYQQNSVPTVPVPPRPLPNIGNLQTWQNRTLPNTRPSGNFPVSGEIRATAPHLRPLSTSAPSIPPASHGLPHHQPIQFDRVRHLENMGFQNPSVLPRAPTSGSNFTRQYLSQAGNKVGGGANLMRSNVSADVVYLLDDD